MRVAFVVRDPAVKYSLMCLSAFLKREGHHCDLILASREKDLVRAARERGAEVVAFSCTSGRHVWATEVGRAFKKHLDVITVIGGPHATYFPEVIADEAFDVACRGEGEEAFLELLNKAERHIRMYLTAGSRTTKATRMKRHATPGAGMSARTWTGRVASCISSGFACLCSNLAYREYQDERQASRIWDRSLLHSAWHS